jgi:hypothetical protein
VLVYAVMVDDDPRRAVELFIRREDAERFLEEVRGDLRLPLRLLRPSF